MTDEISACSTPAWPLSAKNEFPLECQFPFCCPYPFPFESPLSASVIMWQPEVWPEKSHMEFRVVWDSGVTYISLQERFTASSEDMGILKIRGTMLGVPIIRIVVFGGPGLGLGNCSIRGCGGLRAFGFQAWVSVAERKKDPKP